MTRGLMSCNVCALLFGILDKAGRCQTCAQRHHGLTGEDPTHPELVRMMLEAGQNLTKYQRRIIKCRSCGEDKPAISYPSQGTVTVDKRKKCLDCIARYQGRRDAKQPEVVILSFPPTGHRPDGRTCVLCQEFKNWARFNKDKKRKTGYDNRCQDCHNASKRKPKTCL